MVFGIPIPPGESGQTQRRVAKTPVKKFNTFRMGRRRAFFMPRRRFYRVSITNPKQNKLNLWKGKENSFKEIFDPLRFKSK